MFGFNDQPNRSIQTPAEVAEALSHAVDGLDITDGWADAAAVDLSPNNTRLSNAHNPRGQSQKPKQQFQGLPKPKIIYLREVPEDLPFKKQD